MCLLAISKNLNIDFAPNNLFLVYLNWDEMKQFSLKVSLFQVQFCGRPSNRLAGMTKEQLENRNLRCLSLL